MALVREFQLRIDVPGRAFEFRPGFEPGRSVDLPLVARPRPGLHLGYGLGLLLLGALGGLLLAMPLLRPDPTPGEIAVALSLGGFMFVWGAASGLTLLADLARGDALVIDADGFRDRRTGAVIAWRDVWTAEYRYARIGVAGLALDLGTAPRRQNPFRVGYDRRRRNELVVPMKFLTLDAWTVAFVFEALIEHAGGEVTRKPAPRGSAAPLQA